ncbi:MAG TPA: phosphohydrolase [Bacteroidales bacterium]|nr:phosphohydrolase [Bacteroidales bacterium]
MTNYNVFISAAANLAKRLHAGQFDKAGEDYFKGHISSVANQGKTWLEKVTGYLHDASEDTPHTEDEVLNFLEQEAGEELPLDVKSELATALTLLNSNHAPSRKEYIATIGEQLLATTVKLYDLQNNMDLTRLSAPTQKDLDRLKRYQSEYDYLKQKYTELSKI